MRPDALASLISRSENEVVQAGRSECGAFCGIFQHTTVTGNKYPLIVRLSKKFYPIHVSRVPPAWQSENIFYVKGCVIFMLNESM